jgi:OHCU decarboxylase
MAQARPFSTETELLASAERIWEALSAEDRLEAFAAHPRIGGPAAGLAAREQSGTRRAPENVLAALARANRSYEERFGHIFIVCASGKSGEEMLALCLARLHNAPSEELAVASEEQKKITRLRLQKFVRPS